MIRVIMTLGVVILSASSAFANYNHVQNLGYAIIGLVAGAELIKFAALGAVYVHAQRDEWLSVGAAFALWLVAVVFSLTNTFGNSLARHAEEQARIERDRESGTRAEHVIVKDIAALPMCGKGKARAICEGSKPRLDALNAEIAAARKRGVADKGDSAGYVRGDPVREGMAAFAGLFGYELPKHRVFLWVTLLWTLLAEIGSGIGVIAIPRKGSRP
jgi:hypothetical protein